MELTDVYGLQLRADRLGNRNGNRFRLKGLFLGAYTATAYVHQYRMAVDHVELTESRPDVVEEFRLPRLPALAVTVVTPDGRPFKKAREENGAPGILDMIVPVATRTAPGERFEAMRGDGNDPVGIGEFWRDRPPPVMGTLFLHAELPAYVSLIIGQAVLQTQLVEPGAKEIQFVLSVEDAMAALPSLRVEVRDEVSSQCVEGARVELSYGWGDTIEVRTDTDGRARLEPVPPGRLQFFCRKEGYATSRQEVVIEPGRPTDLVVRLVRPVGVEVRIVSPEGVPCSSQVSVTRLQKDAGYLLPFIPVRTSRPDGYLALPDVDRGTYLLGNLYGGLRDPSRIREGQVEWVPANTIIDTTSGSPPPIEVRLSNAVTLWIRSPPGDPVDLEFQVTDARGLPVCAERFDLPYPRFLHLAPGTYHVRFRDSSGKVLEDKEVSLRSDPVDVTFGG